VLTVPCVLLDAGMTTAQVIVRLARQGHWLDPGDALVRAVISDIAGAIGLPANTVARQLARPCDRIGAAIRRQWQASILWYARPLAEVLRACHEAATPDQPLFRVLALREDASLPLVDARTVDEPPSREGIVQVHGVPVAVMLNDWEPAPSIHADTGQLDEESFGELMSLPVAPRRTGDRRPDPRSAADMADAAPAVHAWPRIDAPDYVPAGRPFEVVIGLAGDRQADVSGGEVVIRAPSGTTHLELGVTLVADGVDASGGWERPMRVDAHHPTRAEVRFTLTAREPDGPEPVRLVILEVRYHLAGAVCGVASRPLVIGRADVPRLDLPDGHGSAWLAQPASASPVGVTPDPDGVDLTIEIFKSDGNPARGSYSCLLSSPHRLGSPLGPFPIELDDDAKGFARMIVNQVRAYSREAIVDNLLVSHGRRIARALGPGVFAVLQEVAARVKPAPPAVLLVSAEPYVPWELACVEPPLDPTRPAFLGAQVALGRWLRPHGGAAGRPPAQPRSRIGVRHMAVMAGLYKAESGLARLPEAEAEAKTLQQTYDAVPLPASLQGVKQLLDARVSDRGQPIGAVEAIHFAGHGDYDPATPDAAVVYLSDGAPLFASLFGSARYGGDASPMFFLNACMAGIGDELLGDAGGFPGNCLDGGFAGVLGALWEIDDKLAHQVAIEFWRRALPLGGTEPEPLGKILQDLRAKYVPDTSTAPAATYLAYVYYGHPRLTLRLV
jgi:hypothetical protein